MDKIDSDFPMLIQVEGDPKLRIIKDSLNIPQGVAFYILERNFDIDFFTLAQKIYDYGITEGDRIRKNSYNGKTNFPPTGCPKEFS